MRHIFLHGLGQTPENWSRTIEYMERVSDIACPSLLICGEKDKANKKVAIELKERLQLTELKFIADAGHEVNKDAPEALGWPTG